MCHGVAGYGWWQTQTKSCSWSVHSGSIISHFTYSIMPNGYREHVSQDVDVTSLRNQLVGKGIFSLNPLWISRSRQVGLHRSSWIQRWWLSCVSKNRNFVKPPWNQCNLFHEIQGAVILKRSDFQVNWVIKFLFGYTYIRILTLKTHYSDMVRRAVRWCDGVLFPLFALGFINCSSLWCVEHLNCLYYHDKSTNNRPIMRPKFISIF